MLVAKPANMMNGIQRPKHLDPAYRTALIVSALLNLPALIGGDPQPTPIEPHELMAQLNAMQPINWIKIRDELISLMCGEAIKTVDLESMPMRPNSIGASAA